MKLSFVIPSFNEENYLPQCLESILKDIKNKNFETEIIVVNNASTDRTRELALGFPDVLVVDEPVKGIVHARRAGYLKATGDLIANVDADTRLPEGWSQNVVDFFNLHKDAVAYSGPFIFYDMGFVINFYARIFYLLGYITYLFNKFVFKSGSMLQGGNFIFRKTAFEQTGGYDTNIVFYGEDSDVARRLNNIGDVVFSFNLPIYASGRRLKGEGVIKAAFKYIINYFWIIFFKKPLNKNYTDIRF
jgi:glycosyltransferase involved in cell wall biosynthesis